jgi:hypothetical protein
MKTSILLTLLILSTTSFAASSPIIEDVVLKNKEFSQKIYEALGGKEIKGLISCKKTAKSVSCRLIKGGWNYFGNEAYGSGDQDKLTKKLYDSLTLKPTTEDGMKFKTIELNVEDPHGGTERNQITCTRVGKQAEDLGLRDTCQVLNAL